jgi:hypothetical protein
MALPSQITPVYSLKIPSTGKEIKYRPFLVKDEKALLIAQQSEDLEVMISTLKQVIVSCVSDDIDVNALAIFDLEYIFSQIRAKSVGEYSDLVFTCGHCDNEKNKYNIKLDVSTLEVTKNPEHTNKIPLFDNVGVMMKYPSLDILKKIDKGFDDPENVIDIITDCIDVIYTDTELFHAKEQTKKELKEFLENLTKEQFDKLETFFATMPKFQKLIEFDCPACGGHNKLMLEGVQNFF